MAGERDILKSRWKKVGVMVLDPTVVVPGVFSLGFITCAWFSHVHGVLRLVELLVWPAVALVAILFVRPYLSSLLSGARLS